MDKNIAYYKKKFTELTQEMCKEFGVENAEITIRMVETLNTYAQVSCTNTFVSMKV